MHEGVNTSLLAAGCRLLSDTGTTLRNKGWQWARSAGNSTGRCKMHVSGAIRLAKVPSGAFAISLASTYAPVLVEHGMLLAS